MYKIAICDDEEKILENITLKIKKEFEKYSYDIEYFSTSNPKEMMDSIENEKYDIIFLDIDMPHFSGMDIATYLNEKMIDTMIIFITSHDALVYKTFAYRPFGFIRKTYIDEELHDVISRIEKELTNKKMTLNINKGNQLIRIAYADIIYIEAEANYINIFTKNENIRIRGTMISIEKKLSLRNFVRCHKGYLINVDYLSKLTSTDVYLKWSDNTITIPIGRSYEKDVRRKILELIRD